MQYSTVQYSTVQHSTVQYSTVQYSTVQYMVLAVLDGWANVTVVWLLKDTKNVVVAPNGLVCYMCWVFHDISQKIIVQNDNCEELD